MKRLLLTLCSIVLMVTTMTAAEYYDFVVNGIYYKKEYNYSTSRYDVYVASMFGSSSSNTSAYSGAVVVPETVTDNGVEYNVTGVSNYAFFYCSGVTSVKLPVSVKYIGTQAFQSCTGLVSIEMLGVTSFSSYAFQGCSSLESATIAEGTTILSSSMFYGCSKLNAVVLPSTLKTIYNNSFSDCSSLESITLPSGVTSIGSGAFSGCSKLASINIPAGLSTINESAFSGCSSLASITLPSSILSLGNYAFNSCSSLETINFPSSVITIGDRAFQNCTSLESVTFNEGMNTIRDYAFYGCSNLSSVDLPASIVYIGPRAFGGTAVTEFNVAAGNTKYVSDGGVIYDVNKQKLVAYPTAKQGAYTVPSTVTSIDDYAFAGAAGLTELTVPSSVTSVGRYAINGCNALSKVVFEDGETVLNINIQVESNFSNININGNYYNIYSFSKSNLLKEVYIGRNLNFSGYTSFYNPNCALEKLTIGEYVTQIPKYSFYNVSNISTVDVKGGLQTWAKIDMSASSSYPNPTTLTFDGVKLSGDVSIPDGIASLQKYTFRKSCEGVTSVSLPASLETVEDGAFTGLTGLTSATLAAGNTSFCMVDGVVYTADKTKLVLFPALKTGELNIPSGITAIGNNLFNGCSGITKITLPNTVQTIGQYAFANCTALKSINIPASVTSIGNYAFQNDNALEKMTIEDGTEPLSIGCVDGNSSYIGYNNYTYLYYLTKSSSLKDFYLGRDITSNYTISLGTNINNLTIGGQVTSVPSFLFYGGTIRNVDYNGTLADWCKINFVSQYATLPYFNSSVSFSINGQPLIGEITIPEGVTSIGKYAFYGITSVTGVTLPSSVANIAENAFNASNLDKILVNGPTPSTLANTNAFNSVAYFFVDAADVTTYKNSWTEFASRIFPKSSLSTSINVNAQDGKSSVLEQIGGVGHEEEIVSLKIMGSINSYDIIELRNKMINLRYLDLADANIVTEGSGHQYYTGYTTETDVLGPYTFYKVTNLRSVVLPRGITKIGSNAFVGCTKLSSVTGMGDACKTISNNAFGTSDWQSSPAAIKSIEIGNGVTSIGTYAFYNCPLETVTFGNSVSNINSYAFSGCSRLKSLTFPESLTRIESDAFQNCTGLQEVSFNDSLKYIGSYAFQNCSSLKELRLPPYLTNISSYAFNSCSGLTEIHLPDMLESIGDYAFTGGGAKTVYSYTLTPVSIGQNTFVYTGATLMAPKQPEAVFWDYYYNTQWSQFTTVNENNDATYAAWYVGENQDVVVDEGENIPNRDEDGAYGELRPGSGLIYDEAATLQKLKELILKWSNGKNYPSFIDNGKMEIGELKFNLSIQANKWYFFSFPFDIDLHYATFPTTHYVWRYYDGEERAAKGNGGWKNISAKTLNAGQGYIFRMDVAGEITLTVKNPDFNQILQNVTLAAHASANAQDASWNFIGIPYLSYYEISNMETLDNGYPYPITVWNPDNNTYDAVMPGDDEYELHPFQAFFVQKPTDKNSVDFQKDKRTTYNQIQIAKENQSSARATRVINEDRMIVNLAVSNGKFTDKTRVIFNDDKSLKYEEGIDASKFFSDEAVAQLYTLDNDGTKYAINVRPKGNQVVKLGFTAPADGVYTISAPRMDCAMMLKDLETNVTHEFCDGGYEFLAEAGTTESRFVLMPSATVTSLNGEAFAEGVDGGLNLSGLNGETVSIYNASGALVVTTTDNGKITLPSGAYIVNLGENSKKIIVK